MSQIKVLKDSSFSSFGARAIANNKRAILASTSDHLDHLDHRDRRSRPTQNVWRTPSVHHQDVEVPYSSTAVLNQKILFLSHVVSSLLLHGGCKTVKPGCCIAHFTFAYYFYLWDTDCSVFHRPRYKKVVTPAWNEREQK